MTLGRRPWERGRPARSGPQARHMGKRTGRLRFRETPITPRAVPRAGEWVDQVCRSCRRLAGLRPVAGKMPALPEHRSQGTPSLPGPCLGRGSGWLRCVAPVGALRAFGPLRARCPRSQDIAPRGHHRSRSRASGGGVGESGVSLLSAPCGPSARCGQDARAPRTSLPGDTIAPRAVPRVGEWNVPDRLRADRQCNQTHIELTRPRRPRHAGERC